MKILVTGGLGYIGSHVCVELLNLDYDVIVIDNLSNSNVEVINRIKRITNKSITYYMNDLLDFNAIEDIFSKEDIDCVIHCAGYKAVGESINKPIEYYRNNIQGTLTLIEVMKNHNCKKIIFSSSATVYGNPKFVPITEDHPKGVPTNPYGWTKSMIEQIFNDLYISDNEWNIIILRYFNPIGAHKSGLIGEDPNGIPNNLLPYISQVAVGKFDCVKIFGNDYKTSDGTGVRDYIHVVDLALGHIKAIDKIKDNPGIKIYNLGTGNGYSVLDIINAFSESCGFSIPYKIEDRRSGDIDACYSDPSLANKELKWKAQYTIKEMCDDSWRWQNMNPNGYK